MNKVYINSLLGIGGIALGFGVGWVVSKSVTTKKLRVVLEKELKDMEKYFDRRGTEKVAKRNLTKPTPQELFEDQHGREELDTIISAYTSDAETFREINDGRAPTDDELRALGEPDAEPEELRTTSSVFELIDPEDVGDEIDPPLIIRTPDKPYVIPIGDFMSDVEEDYEDYDKLTITYYSGDQVLTDDADKVIPEIDKTIGLLNLKKFGKDSDNADIVYVRNEKLKTDFEIARVDGSYTSIVLGFEAKSSKKTIRAREDD